MPDLMEISFLNKLLPWEIRERQMFTCTCRKPEAQFYILLATRCMRDNQELDEHTVCSAQNERISFFNLGKKSEVQWT